MQQKLCKNKLPFSLPIIEVEQKFVKEKPKYASKTMQQLTAIFASDYWSWAKVNWGKTKFYNKILQK